MKSQIIDFNQLIKDAEPGEVALPKKVYVFLPQRYRSKEMTSYLCSYIVSIVKYDERRVNVSFLDLPSDFKGGKINLLDDDDDAPYNWHFDTMNPILLNSFTQKESWKEFH